MLDLRLYRVTLLPFVIALVVVAFSLHPRPGPLTSPPQGVTFNVAEAAGAMRTMAAADRDRAPGSADDSALAASIATHAPPNGLADAHFSACERRAPQRARRRSAVAPSRWWWRAAPGPVRGSR